MLSPDEFMKSVEKKLDIMNNHMSDCIETMSNKIAELNFKIDRVADNIPLGTHDFVLCYNGKKYLLEPNCDHCSKQAQIVEIPTLNGNQPAVICAKCGHYLKVIQREEEK